MHIEHYHKKNNMAKIVNPNAAGIDIASNVHYVAVSESKCKNPVRNFKGFTKDLHELAKWLVSLNISTVAMESTGSYWFQLYTILLDYGIEVFLVNAYHVKNVPGRKTDVSDAQWLQELHENGYLKACFQPDNLTRELRTYVRLRKQIIREMATETQRMQKAMINMNIKLHDVISDINGQTGSAIVSAILGGERNAQDLASLRNKRIKCSEETLIKSLEGNWRPEQLFCLKLAYNKYQELNTHLQEIDKESETLLKLFATGEIEEKEMKSTRIQNKQPLFNVGQHLYDVYGVDVMQIYGVKQTTALTIFSETGANLKATFPTVKQFLKWLNVVPDNKISGGKILSSKVRKRKNKAGQAFREAANSLWRAQNPYGDYLRSKKAKSGSGQAIVATAKKIATIYYKMVTEKVEFDPYIIDGNRQTYLQKRVNSLTKTLNTINGQLSELQNSIVTS
jgi:transposase